MVVRIRLTRTRATEGTRRKNARTARLAAIVLTLVAICLASFGAWRIAEDLGWGGAFVISQGLFSHWQVWIAGAVFAQWGAWKLLAYAKSTSPENEENLEPSVT
jgi:hypothetical protein